MAEDGRSAEPASSTAPEAAGDVATGQEAGEPDFSKKHPLECRWTLWFDNPSGKSKSMAAWGQTLRSVYTFDTVEDFWCLYNNIKPPSWLPHGTDFHLFKEGIEPKWEDPRCEHGGKWTVLVPKGPNSKSLLDTYWLHSLLACIGEQFTEGDEVCGMVVNVRGKQDKVCLWSKTAANEAAQVSLGKELKQFMDLPDTARIGYLAHSDAKNMDKRAKDRYTV